jgi:hypothetical protein
MRSSSASRSASEAALGARARLTRRRFLLATGAALVWPGVAAGQEGVFLSPEDAPRTLFPEADRVVERRVAMTPDLRRRIETALGTGATTLWEREYRVFTVSRDGVVVGTVVIVEEIGKHRPITFAVAADRGGRIHDIAVLVYREPYGGDVRHPRFLRQYRGKALADPMLPYRDITNIAGATLSVEATGRAARKALAVLRALEDER